MSYNSKYKGSEVEALLDKVQTLENQDLSGYATKEELGGKQDKIDDLAAIRSGAEKGATALQSVPSEYITESELNGKGYATTSALNDKVDKVTGKQLSTEDFTSALKTKLEGLSNYDDTELSSALSTLRGDFDKLVSGDTTTAIKTFNEVIAFLDGIQDSQDLSSIIASIEQQIAAKQDKITDLETIRSGAAKGATALQSYTEKYTGTITGIKMNGASKGTSGVVDLGTVITAHQDISGKADDTSVVHKTGNETISGAKTFNGGVNFLGSGDSNAVTLSTNTRINVNGTNQTVLGFGSGSFYINHGNYNLLLRGKATRPTYNGADMALYSDIPAAVTESTVSGWGFTKNTGTYSKPSGGIPASDLAPDVFLQGEKGEKGDKGDTGATGPQGVSVTSVVQTTTSSADGGSNVVTVTLSDGKTSTFTVKNGSKGSQGEKGDKGDTGAEGPQGVQGIQGPKGDTGADGAQGPKGDQGEQGPKGDKGDKGDTGAAGTNGTNGVSVSSVKQTTTSTSDGGTNVVTVTLSNGTTSTFNVKNGSKGSNGTNGTNGTNGATFTPSVDSAGNLSWTNDKGLANPATVNIKGPKGDKGDAGSGGSGGGSGAYAEVNHGTSDTTFTLTPNTFHIWDEVASLTLTLGSETAGVANEYLFQFASGATATALTLPDDIKWTEELVIEPNRIYQISILKGLASVLSWENANTSALIENHITYDEGNFMNGGTITFEYPTASEITFYMEFAGGGSLVVPQGSTQVSVTWFEPVAPIIQSIIPTEDSIYKYILP
jgi:hypothetical protein